MSIKGNTVGTTMPRTDYEQTDSTKADYLKGKTVLDQKIQNAQNTANNAQTAANAAQTAADNAQTTADNAQTVADNALKKAGDTMTGALNVLEPTEDTHAASKGYVDGKHKCFDCFLTLNDWVGDTAPYTQTVNTDVTKDDTPHICLIPDDEIEIALKQEEAWNCVSRGVTGDGSITFTCYEEKPEVLLHLQIEVSL